MRILIGILALGFLIFFHETGHFLAARLFGVKVESFSIGMGPVLLHKKIGDTDYRLSLLPLGGYCGMKGEKDFQEALDENLPEINGDKDSFYGVHPFKRLLIAFAGPFFNLLFAWICFVVIALMGYTYWTAGTTVNMADEIYENIHSAAHEAGLESGDTIKSINGKEMEDFTEIAQFVALHGDEDLVITVDRKSEILDFTVHSDLDKETGSGKIGISVQEDSIIQKEYPQHNFFQALGEGFVQSGKMLSDIGSSLKVLFKGVKITSAVSGPARTTTMLGDTIQEGFQSGVHDGFVTMLQFLALISISLFITNLLPVPVLDGGLILFALIECITRKKMSPKLLKYIQYAGLVIVAAMFAVAVFGDISYFIKAKG